MMGQTVRIGRAQLRLIEHAKYAVAHPDEDSAPGAICSSCAIAEREDTKERVLLWLCGGINWSVSRHDPNAERHRMELAA